ncbi:MAG: type VI secretion system-associated FHA domain protein TagH [Gammaproteobacteria bacterium]|nr:type VI secretion system-associated FHA domain protein TagH [Gammaproteobacteria bacterium]
MTLRILKGPGNLLETETIKVFDEEGGTIGRAPNCDWSLPDPEKYISGTHASVLWQDGEFYLIDTSSNGTYVNNMPEPIPSGKPLHLTHEDQFGIGNYKIEVSLDPKDAERAKDCSFDISTILVEDKAFKKQQLPKKKAAPPAPKKVNPLKEKLYDDIDEPTGSWTMLDIDDLERDDVKASKAKSKAKKASKKKNSGPAGLSAASDTDLVSLSLEEPPEPPKAKKKKKKKKDTHRNPTNTQRVEMDEAIASVKKGNGQADASLSGTHKAPQMLAPLASNQQMLQAFIRGLGVDEHALPNRQPEDLIEDVGRIFGELLSGLQTLMQNRSLLKDRYKLSQTMMKPKSNNPIKFSAGMEDALPRLLSGKAGSYKAAADAVHECYFDVNADMEAMNEAMSRALFEYLKMFDPDNLREQFDHVMGKNKFLGGNKKRYWDLYADRYASLVQHKEGRMPDGFAEAFVSAFENSISKRNFKKESGGD